MVLYHPNRCIPTLTHLFLIFVNLINEFFELEKENTATVTFKQASITGEALFGTSEAISSNSLTGETTGAHLTGALGQSVLRYMLLIRIIIQLNHGND